MSSSDYMPIDYPDFADQVAVVEWVGRDIYNAVYTVQLGELIDKGVFDWKMDILDWSSSAYSAEQYERVCAYFIERFRFREISIEPFYEWATMLKRKLVYELMPKYRNLYEYLDDIDPAQNSADYTKRRAIGSDYPETLLSGNSDYISNGQDEEREDIKRGDLIESYNKYIEGYQAIDAQLLNELESMFIGLYTASIDGM